MSNWVTLQIIILFSINTQESLTSVSRLGWFSTVLLFSSCSHSIPALVFTVFEILQPTCLCLYAKAGNVLSAFVWLIYHLVISKFSDGLNQKFWKDLEFSSTSEWMDEPVWWEEWHLSHWKYVRQIRFAYSSWGWVYENFKDEVTCTFSYDERVREHEICENILVIPRWACQTAKAELVVWRKLVNVFTLNRRISVQEKRFN